MSNRCCEGLAGRLAQFDQPTWEPLVAAVGERLASGFMWMQENELGDGTHVHAYKHIHTRRYLYLSEGGTAYRWTPCDLMIPLRLDYAIQAAVCSWWLLSGWEQEDLDAVCEAVECVPGTCELPP